VAHPAFAHAFGHRSCLKVLDSITSTCTFDGVNADSWGVSFGYSDSAGVFHQAEPAIRAAIHRALGAPEDGSGDPPETDAVVVLYPEDRYQPTDGAHITCEGGEVLGVTAGDSVGYEQLGFGYHLARTPQGRETRLIVTPGVCFVDEELHTWGWAVQLYAMRSSESWGFGDFRDLRRLNEWSVERNSSMVLVNPLHAPTPVANQEPSPYFPTSRIAKNPLHLCLEEVPGWSDDDPRLRALAAVGRALNNDRQIDRDRVFAAKSEALGMLWSVFGDASANDQQAFEEFLLKRSSALRPIATFFMLVEREGGDWRRWPAALQDAQSETVRTLSTAHDDRIRFHLWVQWLLERQLSAASDLGGRRFDVMTDLAIGVDRAGADAWVTPGAFCLDVSVGAPPDDFNQLGQNWGLPPFNPWKLREHAYEPFVQTVRAAFTGAGALRMDHVMGLFRLYWIPDGCSARQGCYVYLPFRDLIGIVALESMRFGAYVVGEDLGTVEPYVREELSRAKILGYQLLQFEDGPAESLRSDVLAAFTTHDLPTIAGLWTGSDTREQLALSLSPNIDGLAKVRASIATRSGVTDNDATTSINAVVHGVYADLAKAPCMILNATLDDALGVEERPNMPGTINEWPNWRIGLPKPLEAVLNDPCVDAVARTLGARGRS
jgi:4-alpha-glucanotransferase